MQFFSNLKTMSLYSNVVASLILIIYFQTTRIHSNNYINLYYYKVDYSFRRFIKQRGLLFLGVKKISKRKRKQNAFICVVEISEA